MEKKELVDLVEFGWTIICSAGNGNWKNESSEWQEAAAKFRDQYHHLLDCAGGALAFREAK
jgi:hypothetical protein